MRKEQEQQKKEEKTLADINAELNNFLRENKVKIEPIFVQGEHFGEKMLKVRLEVNWLKNV